jgi:hypothetical protein
VPGLLSALLACTQCGVAIATGIKRKAMGNFVLAKETSQNDVFGWLYSMLPSTGKHAYKRVTVSFFY